MVHNDRSVAWNNREHFRSPDKQILMIFVTFMLLIKTFFFLRIFDNLTRLVIMIKEVVFQIVEFLIFYFIFIFMFSIIIGIIGVGHYNLENDIDIMVGDYPSFEYDKLKFSTKYADEGRTIIESKDRKPWAFVANVLFVLRYSLGDYGEFREIEFLNEEETWMFWLIWMIIVAMTSIIFLNFIIAEVSDSYEKV